MSDGARVEQAGPACALLWDLDNVTTSLKDLTQLAHALTRFVGPDSHRIAAAHRTNFRASRALLAACGIEILSGGRRASGADRKLLFRARQLHRQGVGRFVLVSNDGDFAPLAKLGDVHLVTTNTAYLSAKLVATAAGVSVLVREPIAGTPGVWTPSWRVECAAPLHSDP